MNIRRPQILTDLIAIDDFSSYVQAFLVEELPVLKIESREELIEDAKFLKIEIRKSFFKNCIFRNCNFEKASFIDVVFQECDLSNSKFAGAYFDRCRFAACKCIGIDMSDTVVKQTTFTQSNFQYSHFNHMKMIDVLFDHIDFTESSMIESRLKRFVARDSRFVKNNFFKTMLATVDFTNNELVAPTVSTPPIELKGAIINMFQAANLIGLWGVIVEQ